MTRHPHRILATLLFVSVPLAASAQGTAADYARAEGLRAKYEAAAVDIAGPPAAIGKTHRFWYRKSVPGGEQFLAIDADTTRFRLLTPSGRAEVLLALPGRHNVANALAAAAAGVALGLAPEQIAAGLARVQPVAGRLSWKATREGARVLDDSYNANPTSLRAAIDLLASMPGQRWLVLGDMKELGADAPALHEECGRAARAQGIDRLYTLGALARHAADGFGAGRAFDSFEALVDALRADLAPGVAALVKGSRSMRMERVVAALTGEAAGEAH